MSEQQPEAEHWLGENIKDSITDNLAVDADVARTIGDAPDAVECQLNP